MTSNADVTERTQFLEQYTLDIVQQGLTNVSEIAVIKDAMVSVL